MGITAGGYLIGNGLWESLTGLFSLPSSLDHLMDGVLGKEPLTLNSFLNDIKFLVGYAKFALGTLIIRSLLRTSTFLLKSLRPDGKLAHLHLNPLTPFVENLIANRYLSTKGRKLVTPKVM